MSTEIKHNIKGRYEDIETSTPDSPKYLPSDLYITRFYGGEKNGRMLQITIQSNETSHIQLTQKEVQKLIWTLSDAFDDELHPSI